MKKFAIISIVLCVLFWLSSCGHKELSSQEIKESYGEFREGETIKYEKIDITPTPIYKRVKKHPEEYTYLKKVDIYKMAYLSDGLLVTGFMVAPKKIGKYPCVVYNRGGNQEFGRLLVASAVDVMAPLAANGYVVVASNYRGNSGSEGKEEFGGKDINDVLNLMTSLSEIPMADATRIGMFGISRGGMMTYLALKQSNQIKATATVGGVANLFNTIKYHEEIESVCEELIPNYATQKNQSLTKRSAVFWADQMHDVPMLIFHGGKDQHVSVSESKELSQKLSQVGHEHKLIIYKNDNHGIRNHREEAFKLIGKWFDKHVKKVH